VAIVSLAAVALPVLAAFLVLGAFVLAEALGTAPFAVTPPQNLAEAAAFGDAAGILARLSRGDDPNTRWPIRPTLVDAGAVRATGVEAALLMRRAELVTLLLRRGARADDPRALACLAQAVGVGSAVPPHTFGAADERYYDGPPLGGREALMRCGLPFE